MQREINVMKFNPGDKVMRVGDNTPGVPLVNYQRDRPQYGKVYCVSACFKSPSGKYDQVTLAGFPPALSDRGIEVGWPANAFRKVEEIQLCVAVANRVEVPQSDSPLASEPFRR